MFSRYNINDLYLAYVVGTTPMEKSLFGYSSYGYFTVLKKNGENYIDLQHNDRIVTTTINPLEKSYIIYEIEPLSKHYTQEGKRKTTFTRKNVLTISNKYSSIISDKIEKRVKTI